MESLLNHTSDTGFFEIGITYISNTRLDKHSHGKGQFTNIKMVDIIFIFIRTKCNDIYCFMKFEIFQYKFSDVQNSTET